MNPAMSRLPTALAQAISSLGLTISQGARQIDGSKTGYKAAYKRLTRYTKDLPESLRLLEEDLAALGLEIVVKSKE